MESILTHLTELGSLIDTLEQNVETTCAEHRQRCEEHSVLTEKNKTLEEKNTLLESENQQLKTENALLRKQIASLEQQVSDLERRITILSQAVSESQSKLLSMEQSIQALKTDFSEATVPIATSEQNSEGNVESADHPKKKRKKAKAADANQPQLPFDFFD